MMLDQTHKEVRAQIFEVRSQICNVFLIWSATLVVPALATSLYRTLSIGWQPIFSLHLLLSIAYWSVALFRHRLSYKVRAGSIVLGFAILGIIGIWSFGLLAFGAGGLIVAPILATVFFGMRVGFLVLAVAAMNFVIVAGISIPQHRLPPFEIAAYTTSIRGWASKGVFGALAGGSMVFIIGVLNRFFLQAFDTSERHGDAREKSEREYRNILDNMVDTFYRTDRNGQLVMISPSVMDVGGYSPKELIGKQLSQYYVDPNKRKEFLKRLNEGGGTVSEFEAEIQKKGGGAVWAATSARYWKNADGEVLGIEGTLRNITANKQAEEALNRSRRMEAAGQMTGGIAHDYNNMLGVIIGNIQMIQRAAKLDDKSKQRLDRALAAAHRNAELTAKLLGFSSAQPRGTEITAVNDCIVDLEEIIAKSLTASIKVGTDLTEDLWLVDIDPAELEDMILNLAINARDAMSSGGILAIGTANKVLSEDDLSYSPESHAGDYVAITVSDTGIGMQKEVREQIFDPFFSTKEAGKGTGLGLSMVYAFVQRSGGFIKVYSEPGEGTTIRVFLPAARDGANSVRAAKETTGQELSRGWETVLVVDDEEFLVDIAVTQLEELGYRTLSAADGEQALKILKANPDVDLLFSDIIMPGKLDGYELALAARQARPSLKILLTSGFARKREEDLNGGNEAVARLASNLLSKPYTLSELAIAVRYALDKQ